jgi:7-carboxy-7-deazaguanine synthase
VLLRLAVCDARCRWCDTPHAFNKGTAMTPDAILDRIGELRTHLVLVTGGEPLLQREVLGLMTRLCDAGHEVMLETSGAHDVAEVDRRVRIVMDLKCPDSGESDNNRWENLDVLKPSDEVKLVVASKGDFDWSLRVAKQHRLDQRFTLLLSPVWGQVEPRELADWLLASGLEARMQLQLHKLVWGAEATGV